MKWRRIEDDCPERRIVLFCQYLPGRGIPLPWTGSMEGDLFFWEPSHVGCSVVPTHYALLEAPDA